MALLAVGEQTNIGKISPYMSECCFSATKGLFSSKQGLFWCFRHAWGTKTALWYPYGENFPSRHFPSTGKFPVKAFPVREMSFPSMGKFSHQGISRRRENFPSRHSPYGKWVSGKFPIRTGKFFPYRVGLPSSLGGEELHYPVHLTQQFTRVHSLSFQVSSLFPDKVLLGRYLHLRHFLYGKFFPYPPGCRFSAANSFFLSKQGPFLCFRHVWGTKM